MSNYLKNIFSHEDDKLNRPYRKTVFCWLLKHLSEKKKVEFSHDDGESLFYWKLLCCVSYSFEM